MIVIHIIKCYYFMPKFFSIPNLFTSLLFVPLVKPIPQSVKDMLFGRVVGGTGCTPTIKIAWLGSYIYHSDVIANGTQINVK